MKRMVSKSFVLLSILFVLIWVLQGNSRAAEGRYPSRTIEFYYGFGAGGAIEYQTRTWGDKVGKILGVHVIPVPKPGGGQVVETNLLINSPPDGYTMANIGQSGIVQTILLSKGALSLESLRIVCQNTVFGEMICVSSESPWKTFQDFIDYAQKNPGLKFAHLGMATNGYIRTQLLNKNVNLGMIGVPFKSDPEMLAAVLGKHIPAGIFSPMTAKIQEDAGKMRILFSFADPAKFGLDPNIPSIRTFFDKSVADKDIETVGFVAVPAKTPDEIVKILERAFENAAKDPEAIAGMQKFRGGVDFYDSKTATQNLQRALEKYKALEAK